MKIEATAKEMRALLELAELDHGADQPTSEARRQVREAAVRRVPRRLLDHYERLVEFGRAPVVVALAHGACSGCHLRLPTMFESTARRSPAIHVCPHCRRMLYAPELVSSDSHADEGEPARPGSVYASRRS